MITPPALVTFSGNIKSAQAAVTSLQENRDNIGGFYGIYGPIIQDAITTLQNPEPLFLELLAYSNEDNHRSCKADYLNDLRALIVVPGKQLADALFMPVYNPTNLRIVEPDELDGFIPDISNYNFLQNAISQDADQRKFTSAERRLEYINYRNAYHQLITQLYEVVMSFLQEIPVQRQPAVELNVDKLAKKDLILKGNKRANTMKKDEAILTYYRQEVRSGIGEAFMKRQEPTQKAVQKRAFNATIERHHISKEKLRKDIPPAQQAEIYGIIYQEESVAKSLYIRHIR